MANEELDRLRDELQRGLHYDENQPPTSVTHPGGKIPERAGRGIYGEDLLARTAVGRGEIVLDAGAGTEDWNKGGPDLVTLAEAEDGGLEVKFYDNKAATGREKVSRVPSLTKTFDNSLGKYREEWGKLAKDPTRTAAEHELFERAVGLVKQDRYSLVLTNHAGRVSGMTERVEDAGIKFDNMRDTIIKAKDLKPLKSPFDEAPPEIIGGPPPRATSSPFEKPDAAPDRPEPKLDQPSGPDLDRGPRLR